MKSRDEGDDTKNSNIFGLCCMNGKKHSYVIIIVFFNSK